MSRYDLILFLNPELIDTIKIIKLTLTIYDVTSPSIYLCFFSKVELTICNRFPILQVTSPIYRTRSFMERALSVKLLTLNVPANAEFFNTATATLVFVQLRLHILRIDVYSYI